MPRPMSGKRSRLIMIGAAGALSVATAVSATAATWPDNPTGKAAHAATAYAAPANLATVTRQGSDAGPLDALAFQRFRAGLGERDYQNRIAGAKIDAAKRAAARAEAAKKAAEEAAARRAAAQQAAARQAAARQAAAQKAAAQQAPAPTASGSPQQIAEGMLGQYGWSASQFSCLSSLWEKESGWSVTAENPSSGAYGIPQALPGSQMSSAGPDWQTDAATQIKWGLGYIQGRYGSPCGAWSHEEADGWY